jgi:hypothetical protein
MKNLILFCWLGISACLGYVAGTLVADATKAAIDRTTEDELAKILRKRAARLREEAKAKMAKATTSPEEE